GGLEDGKWRYGVVVVEVVIEAKVLLVIDPVVELQGELIAPVRLHRRGDKLAATIRRKRDVRKQVDSGGIEAAKRNNISREEIGIELLIRDVRSRAHCSDAGLPLIKRERISQGSAER